jgi:hypothetical protein
MSLHHSNACSFDDASLDISRELAFHTLSLCERPAASAVCSATQPMKQRVKSVAQIAILARWATVAEASRAKYGRGRARIR